MVSGLSVRPITDAEGRYTLPRQAGSYEIKAGREGFIQEHSKMDITAESTAAPLFTLYNKPADAGFYIISTGRYAKLEPANVENMGTQLRSHRGLKDVGKAEAQGGEVRVLFHTDLRMDEISRLDLELHKLKFIKDDEVPGPLGGRTKVKVNLFVSDGEVPITIEPMRSRTDYLVKSSDKLEGGFYAFHTQDMMDPKNEAFDQVPQELKVAFPFEVR
jgi:hypothetical protein